MKLFLKYGGLLAIALSLAVISVCWSLNPPVTALSDFGMQPPTDLIFNLGMIVGGVLIGVWVWQIIKAQKLILPKFLRYLIIYSSFCLSGVGFFPVVLTSWQRPVHWFFALSFFVGYSLFILVYGLYSLRQRAYGPIIFALVVWIGSFVAFAVSQLALEIWQILILYVWIIITTFKVNETN